uniref:Prolyl aminopeptidase n=1 Tax=Vannella robusta TaxID=1487602 RepID=A0A7S4M9R0_9EUKA|mmetsp:Transcript_15538/g.19790  ORF Transcript_15538/g.19790 Transcript_15538/m.19790 type:complete len:126 (+) Transcript_15538:418-795(+)
MECARAWSTWEMATSKLFVSPDMLRKAENDDFSLSFARIESHYFVHGGFFNEDGQLLKNSFKLKDIPGTIVQGRYDLVCPAKTAWELHKLSPHFDFHFVPDAGHSCSEPGTTDLLVRATDKYSDL